jgi:RHS repeat-associated protein
MQTFMDSIPLVKEKLFGYYESDGQARMSSIQVSDHVLAITVTRNGTLPYRFTGKELDEETGLYYYGARYLDPRASRWLSADPAVGEYLPEAPVNEEARKRNGNLPGMGGIYNYVNLHVYHYAGNNPVKYTDPDGRIVLPIIAQYTMQGQVWSDNFIPPNNTAQMWEGGCAITLAGNVAYTHNNATIVTPGTIVDDSNNFNSDGLLWATALNDVTGLLVGNRINVGNGDAFETAFNQLNASATEYYVGIKVNYDGNPNHDHWVGASAIQTLDDGIRYARISRTSTNDNATGNGTPRGGQGWRTVGENIYVPLDKILAYLVFIRTGVADD